MKSLKLNISPLVSYFGFKPTERNKRTDEIKSLTFLVSPSHGLLLWAQMCESLPFAERCSRDGGVGVWRGLVRDHDGYGAALFRRYQEDFMGSSGPCCHYDHVVWFSGLGSVWRPLSVFVLGVGKVVLIPCISYLPPAMSENCRSGDARVLFLAPWCAVIGCRDLWRVCTSDFPWVKIADVIFVFTLIPSHSWWHYWYGTFFRNSSRVTIL